MKLSLVATCAPGIESFVLREVVRLGFANPIQEPGGIRFNGDLETLYEANLRLSMATHVLIHVANFPASTFRELCYETKKINWKQWFQQDHRIAIRATSTRSLLWMHSGIEQRIHREILSQIGGVFSENTRGNATLIARMVDNVCTLSLNSSGEPLYRRGYRLASGKAPLREDLARAAIEATNWNTTSPFLDPMCGSGTLGIEAALWALQIPTGWGRSFKFMEWDNFDNVIWSRVRDKSNSFAKRNIDGPIVCSDLNPGAVLVSKENARRAYVCEHVSFEECPLGAVTNLWDHKQLDLSSATILTNPPGVNRNPDFHKRDITDLYQKTGQIVRQNIGEESNVGLIVGGRKMAYMTGLPLHSGFMSDQGGRTFWCMTRTPGLPLWSFVKQPEENFPTSDEDEFLGEIAMTNP